MNLFKAFGRFVAKLPFAGRTAIRPAYRKFRNSNKKNRTARFTALSKLLAFMVGAHAVQARMGIVALKHMMIRKVSIFWSIVFVGYTVANVAVTIAQATLLCWCLHAYFISRQVEPGRPVEPFAGSEVLTMMVVTLGGQILFLVGYLIYV